MNIEEYSNFYHVDISTQIENKWKNDTVLAIVRDSEKYSIKIRGRDKESLKERFISKNELDKKHNKRVVAVIYCYLLYKALSDVKEANPLLLCRDVRPESLIITYLKRTSNYFDNKQIGNRKIVFRKRSEFDTKKKLPKSLAGKYVRKVYQGKIKPTRILVSSEIEELIAVINKTIENYKYSCFIDKIRIPKVSPERKR